MPDSDQIPTFNLKAVVQETGLKPDTLRAWERRYGLPQPERTAGGHRLYSQRDIDTLKWLVARQQEGLSISRAVDLWQKLEADGQDPLRAMAATPPLAAESITPPTVGDALAELRQAWVAACLAFDEQKSERVLIQAFAIYPVETVCVEVLQAGLARVGQGWYEGEVTVQQEHFASELAVRRLEALLAASPPPTRLGRIVVGCPPEEEHTFGPLMLTLFLRRRGWNVLYLGANVPLARLQATIATVKPELVILSAQHLVTAATLLAAAKVLLNAQVPLAYGGLIFNRLPALQSRIPGHFLGERLDKAAALVEQWLTSAGPWPAVTVSEPGGEVFQRALAHFRERQGMIDAHLWQSMRGANMPTSYLAEANRHLARYILAALSLGDLDFLQVDLAWVDGLLSYHNLSRELLPQYLRRYSQAARSSLGEEGQPVVEWLAHLTQENRSLLPQAEA